MTHPATIPVQELEMPLLPLSMLVFLPDPNLCCPVFLPSLPPKTSSPSFLHRFRTLEWSIGPFSLSSDADAKDAKEDLFLPLLLPPPFLLGPRGGECCFRGKSRGGAGKKMMFTHDHAAQCFSRNSAKNVVLTLANPSPSFGIVFGSLSLFLQGAKYRPTSLACAPPSTASCEYRPSSSQILLPVMAAPSRATTAAARRNVSRRTMAKTAADASNNPG